MSLRPAERRLLLELNRRDFLSRFCQFTGTAFVPAGLWRAFPGMSPAPQGAASPPAFHLQPRYITERPLDATLRKVRPEFDRFPTEVYADRIEKVLGAWSQALKNSPRDLEVMVKSLPVNFSGVSLKPTELHAVRTSPALQVQKCTFGAGSSLDRDAFIQAWRSAFEAISKIEVAEFQITRIDAGVPDATGASSKQIQTDVRYEIVGSGQGFHREQRVGNWRLTWEPSASGEFRISNWQVLDESRARSNSPFFVDVTAAALGNNSSYSEQLLHGADYWRTVLDGACGIDIYGHNGVSVADIDNDGFDDLYICQTAGLPNRLYRNRGDGTFEDITESSGLGILENTVCALFADYGNDGRQDVILVRNSGPLLFLN
jgi:hypothetical protein